MNRISPSHLRRRHLLSSQHQWSSSSSWLTPCSSPYRSKSDPRGRARSYVRVYVHSRSGGSHEIKITKINSEGYFWLFMKFSTPKITRHTVANSLYLCMYLCMHLRIYVCMYVGIRHPRAYHACAHAQILGWYIPVKIVIMLMHVPLIVVQSSWGECSTKCTCNAQREEKVRSKVIPNYGTNSATMNTVL